MPPAILALGSLLVPVSEVRVEASGEAGGLPQPRGEGLKIKY